VPPTAPRSRLSPPHVRRWILSAFLPSALALAAATDPPPLLLLEAASSLPNEAERRFAARAADRLAQWIGEAGLSVRRLPEATAIRDGLPGRILLIPYALTLPPALRNRIAAFVRNGGRLIVFYSSDPELASLVGVQLGPYLKAESPGQWSAIRFTRDAPPLTPPRLVQTSGNIRPVYPLEGTGRVIGWWEDHEGGVRPEPAWTLTDRAAWMSHLLLEGESAPRRQLLLALAVHFDPRLLPIAGRRALDRAGASPPYATGTQVLENIRRRTTFSSSPLLQEQIAALEREIAALATRAKKGDWVALIQREALLQVQFARAYAASLPPARAEFRAVWNHSGLGLGTDTQSWNRTARLLAEHGFTAVFPHVAWAGLALYPSQLVPQSAAGRAVGDPLALCLQAAGRHGLAVHAWVACWNLEGAPESLVARFRAQNRLQQELDGTILPWLCPSRADNVEHQLAILEEIAERYPVAGLHLDYIRFPGSRACYCPACRSAFETHLRRRVTRWPADVTGKGPLASAYTEWRAGQITRFVRLARERLRAVRPSAALSAAVYGYYPGCIQSMGQDWATWVRNDWVTFVCPMNYEADLDRFKRYLQVQMPLAPRPDRIIPGIGVVSASSRLSPLQTLDQIEAVRTAGASGFILFDLTPTLESELFPALRALR